MNSMEKFVVSSTLTDPIWNSTVVPGDMAGSVAELKETAGADTLVAGSATLVQGLLRDDLVDELRLEIYPLTLGVGKRLFPADARLDFQVESATQTSTGVMLNTYRRARS